MHYCYWCGAEFEEPLYQTYTQHLHYEDEDGLPVGEAYGSFEAKDAYCPKCKKSYYMEELQLDYFRKKDAVNRKAANLISYKDMVKLPRRYSVSRKDIETILELDNDDLWDIWVDYKTPSTEQSDKMKQALNDPVYFIKQLKKHRRDIDIEAYARALKRAEGFLK